MSDLHYGVIGSGMMGIEHMANVRLLDGASVTAVADPHEASRNWAKLSASEAGDELEVFDDYRDMLGEVDAVILCTPNHTHRSILDDVFQTDLHVLC